MVSGTRQERAEVEEAIAGRTLCDVLRRIAESAGEVPAFSDHAGDADAGPGGWLTLTWSQARQRVLEIAAGFAALGLAPAERVALMLPNRSEHVLADLGAVHAGGVGVTLYPTLAPEQVTAVAADCDARIVVLDGAAQLDRWRSALSQLPRIRNVIVRNVDACPADGPFMTWDALLALGRERLGAAPDEITARVAAIGPYEPAALLYTPGTTGEPKGVLLTHRNVLYQIEAAYRAGVIGPRARLISYLPLAHAAERVLSIYLPIRAAGHVYFCPDAEQLARVLRQVQPTVFFGVPRVWERLAAGIRARLAAEQDEDKRAAARQAMQAGRRYTESCQYGQATPSALAARFRAADARVFRPLRAQFGLSAATALSTGAAPMPPDVAEFFAGLGMKVLDLYGMTETAGFLTVSTATAFKLGTVGRPLPGMEVAIAGDGEILARGPVTSPGYHGRPDLTAELIDADGWLHTGDIGAIDADGFLSVTARKKELVITAGGEAIVPAVVENSLTAHPLISHAVAYGGRRPYAVALLTLDGEIGPGWARAPGITAGSLAALAAAPRILPEVGAGVAAAAIGILAAVLGLLIGAVAIVIPRIVARRNHPQDDAASRGYLASTGRSTEEVAQANLGWQARPGSDPEPTTGGTGSDRASRDGGGFSTDSLIQQMTSPDGDQFTQAQAGRSNMPAKTPACRCGHLRDAHDHYRPGTDCSACECPKFRLPGLLRWLTALVAWLEVQEPQLHPRIAADVTGVSYVHLRSPDSPQASETQSRLKAYRNDVVPSQRVA